MLVSVAAARTKWCPMARADEAGRSSGVNRALNGAPLDKSMCLGTGCMMWVEHEYEHGYCGLTRIPGVA